MHTRPLPDRGHDDLEDRVRRRQLRRHRKVEVGAAAEATAPVRPAQSAAIDAGRQLADLLDPALLHFEQVREICVDQELERAERGFESVVANSDVFSHTPTDVAVPEHHEVRVGFPRLGLVAEHERCAERIRGGRGERFGPLTVDAQAQFGEEPSVTEEESVREAGQHVARGQRDGEGGPLDECHDAAVTAERRTRGHRPRHGHDRPRYRPSQRASLICSGA